MNRVTEQALLKTPHEASEGLFCSAVTAEALPLRLNSFFCKWNNMSKRGQIKKKKFCLFASKIFSGRSQSVSCVWLFTQDRILHLADELILPVLINEALTL